MSNSYILDTICQPNYYNSELRNNSVYFDIPDRAKTSEIKGILLLIAGFGGNANSNVYKKMRRVFADEYRLVTVQCDYFGSEFMQSEVLPETIDNFCEMGPIQAMDNLIALKCVKDYLDDNNIVYDDTNVIAYGHSHGAYLAYIMNFLMPNVLSCIIDNSAWLFPQYIDDSRILSFSIDNIIQSRKYEYYLSKVLFDRDIYDLTNLYDSFVNDTTIIAFHGGADTFININDKLVFLAGIKNSSIEIIGPKKIDDVFKSYEHGLGADFLKMFDYVMSRYRTNAAYSVLKFENRAFRTKAAQYNIDNSDGIPILYCVPVNG